MITWCKLGAVLLLFPSLGVFAVRQSVDTVELDEAVVVAYGFRSRSSYTGSLSSVSGRRFIGDLPVLSFEEALQGSFAGLHMSPVSSQPGSAMNLRIRGTGSLNASGEPLYVVDGVPVLSGNIALSSIAGDTKSFNVLLTLSPGDIEQVTILKDAAATSLYGSRAANGVILITTRRGSEGRMRLGFSADWGFGNWAMTNKATLSGDEQHELTYEAFYNEAILYNGKTDAEAAAYAEEKTALYAPLREEYSDWESALFRRRSLHQRYRLSASGGSTSENFYASLVYEREDGLARNMGLEGFNAFVNMRRQLSERTDAEVRFSVSRHRSDVVPETAKDINPWYMLHYACKPNYPIRNADGTWFEDFPLSGSVTNLAKEQGLDKNRSDVFRMSGGFDVGYDLCPGLRVEEHLNYDFVHNESTLYWPLTSSNGKTTDGVMVKIASPMHNIYSSTLLKYIFHTGCHGFDLLAGWEVDDRSRRYLQAKGTNYPGDRLEELENAAVAALVASGKTTDRLLSFLGRIDYSFDGRYYASVSYRRDGSSRFGSNHRWGGFWSGGLSWRLSRESFLAGVCWLDELKIRLSCGVTGTLPSSEYGHLGLVRYGTNYGDLPGMSPTVFPSPDLAWERNRSLNAGVDARFWGCLSLSVDYYDRLTKDLLQDVPVSLTTGLGTHLRNVGELRNRGIEAEMELRCGRVEGISWESRLVLAHNRNEIVRLYGGKDIIDGSRIWREGESLTSFWSREWAGVDPDTGEERWVKNSTVGGGGLDRSLTKNGNEAEKVIVGNADPKLTGGWGNRLSWKGIDVNFLFSFSLGGHVMDDLWTYTESDGRIAYTTIGVKQGKRWQKPGDLTRVPRRINSYTYGLHGSSRHLYSTDHLRLKSLMVSVRMPVKWLRGTGLSAVRLYTAGNNLLTWSAYDDLDPEQGIGGFTTFAFPVMKSCTFGVEIML